MTRRIGIMALGVFAVASTLAGCDAHGGASAAPHPLPTTTRQLSGMLPTTAELPDGIHGGANPISMDTSNTPDAHPSCSDLIETGGFLGSIARPVQWASGVLNRQAVFPWTAWDDIYLYKPGQAAKTMAALRQVAARCAAPFDTGDNADGPPLKGRIRLITLRGMGDEAVEGNVRLTEADWPAPVSDGWIVIWSGDYVLTVKEMGNPLPEEKYLPEAVRAVWQTFQKRY